MFARFQETRAVFRTRFRCHLWRFPSQKTALKCGPFRALLIAVVWKRERELDRINDTENGYRKRTHFLISLKLFCRFEVTNKPDVVASNAEAYAVWQWSNWLWAEAVAQGKRCVMLNLDESPVPVSFQQINGTIVAKWLNCFVLFPICCFVSQYVLLWTQNRFRIWLLQLLLVCKQL